MLVRLCEDSGSLLEGEFLVVGVQLLQNQRHLVVKPGGEGRPGFIYSRFSTSSN